MAATLNSQTIALANQAIGLIGQLNTLVGQIDALTAQWTQLAAATQLAAFPTCALNADGTLGTADTSPSTATGHVIDTRTATASGLNRATSAYNIGLAENLLADVASLLGGNAVAAQAGFPSILAQLTGG